MSDQEMLSAIARTYPLLDRWREILAVSAGPVTGSELAEDDLAWRWIPPSSLALTGLGAASEHLHAVRLLIEARELFPSASSTLSRTAVVGAATTAWMLLPDERDERLRRALSVARDDYWQHIKFGEQVMQVMPADRQNPAAVAQLERLRQRHAQVEELLQRLGVSHKQVNFTDVILPAAVEAAVDAASRPDLLLQWRSMSGAVHALTWHYYGQFGTSVGELDEHGVARVTVGGNVSRLAKAYFTGLHLANCGWKLYAQRAGIEA